MKQLSQNNQEMIDTTPLNRQSAMRLELQNKQVPEIQCETTHNRKSTKNNKENQYNGKNINNGSTN
jgi:hypothetical protein